MKRTIYSITQTRKHGFDNMQNPVTTLTVQIKGGRLTGLTEDVINQTFHTLMEISEGEANAIEIGNGQMMYTLPEPIAQVVATPKKKRGGKPA